MFFRRKPYDAQVNYQVSGRIICATNLRGLIMTIGSKDFNSHKKETITEEKFQHQRDRVSLWLKVSYLGLTLQGFYKQPSISLHHWFMGVSGLFEHVDRAMGVCVSYKVVERLLR